MSSLKKYPLAIALSVLLILLAILLGQAKHHEALSSSPSAPEPNAVQSTILDSNLPTENYTDLIVDENKLLSEQSKARIALYNANFYHRYGALVGVVAVRTLDGEDLDDAALRHRNSLALSSHDALLLLSVEEEDVYFDLGEDFFPQWSGSDASDFVERTLWPIDSTLTNGAGLERFFTALHQEWIALNHVTEQSDHSTGSWSLLSMMPALLLLLLVILLCTIVDNARYSRYASTYASTNAPPIPFRPVLFWHGPRSQWYLRRHVRHHGFPPDSEDERREATSKGGTKGGKTS